MFTPEDLKLFAEKGIEVSRIEEQLNDFKNGFPFLKISASASIGNGILAVDETEANKYLDICLLYTSPSPRDCS